MEKEDLTAYININNGTRNGRITIGHYSSASDARRAMLEWGKSKRLGPFTIEWDDEIKVIGKRRKKNNDTSSKVVIGKKRKKNNDTSSKDPNNTIRNLRNQQLQAAALVKRTTEHAKPAMQILRQFVTKHVTIDAMYNSTSKKLSNPNRAPIIGELYRSYTSFFYKQPSAHIKDRLMGKHSSTKMPFKFAFQMRVIVCEHFESQEASAARPTKVDMSTSHIMYVRYKENDETNGASQNQCPEVSVGAGNSEKSQ